MIYNGAGGDGCGESIEVTVPMLVGSNPPKEEDFSKEGTSAGHGCVCMSPGADGRVVEGRITLFGQHREVHGFESGEKAPGCINVVVYVVNVRWNGGGPGKVPGAPCILRRKEIGMEKTATKGSKSVWLKREWN
ncbi:hypothetical protein MTP99_001659 [Tenebrio molitor]|nr:hypothetical protein MTP99_001659 [Tenebrio molitor]